MLKRYPLRENDQLQAWDAADDLILSHCASLDLAKKRILIVNDHFGALSVGLGSFDITTYTDSFVSYEGIRLNTDGKCMAKNSLEELTDIYDFVILRLPKSLAFLEDILSHLTHHLNPHSQIIVGSMVKHLAKGNFDLLEKYIGKTTTSLAAKKARLIFASFEKTKAEKVVASKIKIEGFEKELQNASNLFSSEKLDLGTRFFIDHLPKAPFEKILDLGCGNGILGIKAKLLNPSAKLIFTDVSAQAVNVAKYNYQNYFEDEAEFLWTNCYEGGAKESLDLVLCNPPFHQDHTVGDFIALQMFHDAKNALKKDGRIRVIGNTHLAYQLSLKRIFGNSKIVATNKKFMIVEALKA